MKQIIEQQKISQKISPNEKMADMIRRKMSQNMPLTEKEETFLQEQREDNRKDDNPRYGH